MNYWVMFNQAPVADSADLLVIDDAHLAEGALDSLYSVEVDPPPATQVSVAMPGS